MNNVDLQYQNLVTRILDEGREKESARENMPNTIGVSNATISMDLTNGFPLLTTKKMHYIGIIHELLWFLRGDTNIKYLVDNNVNIWNKDAYRWYLKQLENVKEPDLNLLMNSPNENKTRPFTMVEFIDRIKNDDIKKRVFKIDVGNIKEKDIEEYINNVTAKIKNSSYFLDNNLPYMLGDLGKVYGHQWRNQNGVDQIKDVYESLLENPYSRYHIIDGWNKADFPEMALPPCHLLYQFIVRPLTIDERQNVYRKRNNGMMLNFDSEYRITMAFNEMKIPKFFLDLNMYQRSVDTALGLPYNLASMSLLLMIFANATNMVAGEANWIGGDTHIYKNHAHIIMKQLDKVPFDLPEMKIKRDITSFNTMMNLSIDDFELKDYKHHPAIKFELFTGLKK